MNETVTAVRESSTANWNSKPVVASPAAIAPTAAPSANDAGASKRGRKPKAAQTKVTPTAPTVRFFGGKCDGKLPEFTKEYATETEAVLDSLKHDNKYFVVSVWTAAHEIIGDEIKVVKRPVNSERQSA